VDSAGHDRTSAGNFIKLWEHYISEVVLALEPWSARLHVPFITPGAASDLISKAIHDDYDHFKYTFHGFLTSTIVAQVICDYTKEMLVGPFHL
jgi:branched-chain amino acid transport system substrate-binding protein